MSNKKKFNIDVEFLSFSEVLSQKFKSNWLIKDVLDLNSLAVLFGKSGTMKSFCAIDMGLCIATGREWHGHEVKITGTVFYIAGEGFRGIPKRLKAWLKKHNFEIADIPFYTSNKAIDLPKRARDLVQMFEEMTQEHGQPVLVIVDTLNRNFGDGDENITKDMTAFIKSLDLIKDEIGCSVLVVHHSGLSDDRRYRGSSALKGAVDWEYSLSRKGKNHLKLECTKSKDFEAPLGSTPFLRTV